MWINDVFYYSIGNLKGIAEHYESLYTDAHTASLYEVALLKADFDRALNNIGRGKWNGLISLGFKDYRHYGRLQQVVIAHILGISDRKLESRGFWNVKDMRSVAYQRMRNILNNGKLR